MSDDYRNDRARMVRDQIERRGISDERVLSALRRVPREAFLPPARRHLAYSDQALEIECGQTISQPYIVALMTEAVAPGPNDRVLEIGTGSGYQTAVLAELAAEVVTLERHAALSEGARQRLDALGYRNIDFEAGDGTLGWPDRAPYQAIIVTAAAPTCPPPLAEQLAEGGRLVIPVGNREMQTLRVFQREGERIQSNALSPCRFVPLVGAEGWPE